MIVWYGNLHLFMQFKIKMMNLSQGVLDTTLLYDHVQCTKCMLENFVEIKTCNHNGAINP